MFEHDERPEYPYELFGSGFVAKYHDRRFLITARHVMRDRLPEQVRIYADESFARSIPLDVQTKPTDVDPEDWHYGDIVVMGIKADMLEDEEMACVDRLDLSGVRPATPLSVGDRLFATGFPSEDRWIDYDEKRFGFRRVVAAATYGGASTSRDMHCMSTFDCGEVKDRNGFSGSPVFRIVRRERFVVANFAGMMTLGSFFLGANVIYDILDAITR